MVGTILRKEWPDRKAALGKHPLGRAYQQSMTIVTDFGCDVQTYADEFDRLCFPRPKVCPHCQAVDAFIGHGTYPRKPLDRRRAYRIRVKRWLCKACGCTISLLPSFLLSFRHYLLEVIQQVVVGIFSISWGSRR